MRRRRRRQITTDFQSSVADFGTLCFSDGARGVSCNTGAATRIVCDNRRLFVPQTAIALPTAAPLCSMGVSYIVRFYDTYSEVVYRTRLGQCDVGSAPFTAASFREGCSCQPASPPSVQLADYSQVQCCIDFTLPVLQSGVSAMFLKSLGRPQDQVVLQVITSPQLLNSFMTLMLALIGSAHIIWFLERGYADRAMSTPTWHGIVIVSCVMTDGSLFATKDGPCVCVCPIAACRSNARMFPARYIDGIDHAVWWSAVTVTTVGYAIGSERRRVVSRLTSRACVVRVWCSYGDKSPVTRLGRLFAFIWMFAGIAMVGMFTGLIASKLTDQALQVRVVVLV